MIIPIDPDVAKELIHSLVDAFMQRRGEPFKLGKYFILPKYIVVEAGQYIKYKLKIYTFDVRLSGKKNNIQKIVFDVIGLTNRNLTTQVVIRKDGTVIVLPDRDRNSVIQFIEAIRSKRAI